MEFELVDASDLHAEHESAWEEILAAQPMYHSPFCRPEFVRIVASLRDGVQVAIARECGRIVGLFPFQRDSHDVGQPVGEGLSELHGPMFLPDVDWNAQRLVRAAGLRRWEYHHVPVEAATLASFHSRIGPSHLMDLSAGFESYCQQIEFRSDVLRDSQKQATRLAATHGELRLDLYDDSRAGLDCLLQWKAEQHRRTGVPDLCQDASVVELFRAIAHHQSPCFRGMMSVLFAGDKPVAVHLGLRTATHAHFWFPTYSTEFARYSPGIILFIKLAESVARDGIQHFEFGPGSQPYKLRLANRTRQVAIGEVNRSHSQQIARGAARLTKKWLKQLLTCVPTVRPRSNRDRPSAVAERSEESRLQPN